MLANASASGQNIYNKWFLLQEIEAARELLEDNHEFILLMKRISTETILRL